jgi:carotenoid 1,2-hydratase
MYLYSNPDRDVQHPKNTSGAYEWWYFDLYDPALDMGLVMIFYDGLLFSPAYHRSQAASKPALASAFPGVSFSLYQGKRTLFYALNEYPETEASFGLLNHPLIIGSNRIEHHLDESQRTYDLHLDESIPNGASLKGHLQFKSDPYPVSFTAHGDPSDVHHWNLVQPKAQVSGEIHLWDGKKEYAFKVNASGYHDHNIGFEPLERQFDEWYWGRIHLEEQTLIWYLLREHHETTAQAWLIPDHPSSAVESVQMNPLGKPRTSLFGLSVYPAYQIASHDLLFGIEQDVLWDNGPFYQRFRLQATAMKRASNNGGSNNVGSTNGGSTNVAASTVASTNAALNTLESTYLPSKYYGIGEYMYPSRIQSKWTRPLINTRYFQKYHDPDWVKRSPFFSRLTW